MKIAITMQGYKPGDKNETLLDGEMIKNNDADNIIKQIYDIGSVVKWDKELHKKLKNGYSICVINHKKRDISNRIRQAIIVYRNDIDEKLIKDSLVKFDLNYDDFVKLKKNNTKKNF